MPPAKTKRTKPAHPTQPGTTSPKSVAIPKRIRELAVQMIGTERGADAWLAMRNPELRDRTPIELIADSQAEVVENFIEANLSGNFG